MINRAVINVKQIKSLLSAVSATYLSNVVWQFFPADSQLAPSALMSTIGWQAEADSLLLPRPHAEICEQ